MSTLTRRPFPLCTGIAQVLRVRRLTPHMARITLGGPDLDGFFVEEPGEIVTLLWPAPDQRLVLPQPGWRFPPGVADAQHARNYTVRRWHAESGELDVDFVLHDDAGRASHWAAAARPGDRVGFAGPRPHWSALPGAAWTLLVADETGLPALAAIVERLPVGQPALALVEVADDGERQELESAAELTVRWLTRDGAGPGTTTLLADAVRAAELPDGPGQAWGAGEARTMRQVRDHLRGERGLASDAVAVLGYWKLRDEDAWD